MKLYKTKEPLLISHRVSRLHTQVSDCEAGDDIRGLLRSHAETPVWMAVWLQVRHRIRFVMKARWNE